MLIFDSDGVPCEVDFSYISDKCGIYMILCKENGKCYVGSTFNLRKRIEDHIKDMSKGIHNIKELNDDFIKYGIENFQMIELFNCDDCDEEFLKMLEGYYIKKYDCIKSGYNSNNAGISVKCNFNRENLIYEKPKNIKSEIVILKNKYEEELSIKDKESYQIVEWEQLFKEVRLSINECISNEGLLDLIDKMNFSVFLKSQTADFYYEITPKQLKYILKGEYFRCNRVLTDDLKQFNIFNMSNVYIECPAYKNKDKYISLFTNYNKKTNNKIEELNKENKYYINEFISLTRQCNNMYMYIYDNINYEGLIELRKQYQQKILDIEKEKIILENNIIKNRGQKEFSSISNLSSLFKSRKNIITIK